MTPISKASAFSRIYSSGITLSQAIAMSDNDLLRLPYIGRRTLRFIREFQIIET